MPASILILPGLGNSGPDHWQTWLERRHPGARRVEQSDWDQPGRDAWVDALEAAVTAAAGPVVLVAHSLACSLVAHWAGRGPAGHASVDRVAGALLVAPSDVDSEAHTPPEVRCFAPVPLAPLPFRATLVASRNDPYVAFDRARFVAERWGAGFVDAGEQGHINVASGHGPWPEGERMLLDLIAAAGRA